MKTFFLTLALIAGCASVTAPVSPPRPKPPCPYDAYECFTDNIPDGRCCPEGWKCQPFPSRTCER